MNITSSIPYNTPDYEVSYKKRDNQKLIVSCIWLFTCTVNLIKVYKHGSMLGSFDIVWPICTFLYLLIIADTLLAKTTYSIQANRLTVIKSSLLYKKAKIYDIDQMHNLEIEKVLSKKYLIFFKDRTGWYAINFLYNEKEERLDGQLAKVYAEQLLEAILGARAESRF